MNKGLCTGLAPAGAMPGSSIDTNLGTCVLMTMLAAIGSTVALPRAGRVYPFQVSQHRICSCAAERIFGADGADMLAVCTYAVAELMWQSCAHMCINF